MLRLFWVLCRALGALWPHFCDLPLRAAAALGAAGVGRRHQPQRLWMSFAVALPTALLAAIFVPKITLVMSPSIEAWAVVRAPGAIARGDYVMFELRHPIAGPKPVSVTKHALCMAGDRLTMVETPSRTGSNAADARYFCNGLWLGTTLPYAHNGQKLDHMRWSGTIPTGMAYVGSHYARSFDSRYFGLVPVAKLTRMARLL